MTNQVSETGKLYIVATPIGNLGDITLRALETLKAVDFILCEDTRVTKKLLDHHGVKKPLISYHQHSDGKKVEEIFGMLQEGKNLALVTDAGTPGISDPGNKLVSRLFEAKLQTVNIVPIPGPSAVTAIASIAGFPMDKFVFLGFPPAKKGRKKFFEEVVSSPYPVVLYESPYRIIKTLNELKTINYQLQTVVGRELTKKFETVYRGTVVQVLERMTKDQLKGEFVLVVRPA